MSRFVPFAALFLALTWARPALAQSVQPPAAPALPAVSAPAEAVPPCGQPAKQPPANSPPLLRCMEIRAHPVNELVVDPRTYDFYIRTPRTDSSVDRWAPFNEQSLLNDFSSLWKTNFLDNLWTELIDETDDHGL